MYLTRLIDPKDPIRLKGLKDPEILGISTHSKEVRPKDLFIAISPSVSYIDEALKGGAVAIVTDIFNPFLPKEITQIEHPQPRLYAGILANRFYQDPSNRLSLIGTTGTSGKSTTSWMVRHLLGENNCGVIGSLGSYFGEQAIESILNTPEPVMASHLLHEMVKRGYRACAMEVSSHGLDQHRVDHLHFSTAVFLNLTHDHLDYHETMESYYLAKKRFFSLEVKRCVIGIDDPYGERLHQELIAEGRAAEVITFGTKEGADFRLEDIQLSLSGSHAILVHQGERYPLEVPMIGAFHLWNMVTAIASILPLSPDLTALIGRAKTFAGVPGRGEIVARHHGFTVMVDHAHKPDALEKLLAALQQAGAKKITTVFGCGGDRDPLKRPIMARIAEKYSHRVIVTTDNPRKEDPEAILRAIVDGFTQQEGHEVIADRKSAIRTALERAEPGELVLIAGRGHEKEQKMRTASIPFLDSEVAKNLLDDI